MNDKQAWFWIDNRHRLRELALRELIASIHAGAVSPHALTWTSGMATFVEATTVPELRDACRLAPQKPSLLPPPGDIVQPSGVVLSAWQRTARLTNPPSYSVAAPTATVPPPRQGAPNLAPGTRPPSHASTSAPAQRDSVNPDEATSPPSPSGRMATPAPPPTFATPHEPIPSLPKPPLSLVPENDDGGPSSGLPAAAKLLLIAAVVIVSIIAVAIAVVLRSGSRTRPTASAFESSSAPRSPRSSVATTPTSLPPAPSVDVEPPPIPPEPKGPWKPCETTPMHKRLIVGGSAKVPLEVLAVPGKNQVSVTFGARNNTAVGFVLDQGTLQVRNSYSRRQGAPVRHVTTLFRHDAVAFRADLDSPEDPVQNVFSLGGTSGVRLGVFRKALTLSTGLGAAPRVLWNLPFASAVTNLQAVSAGSHGIAAVLRSNNELWLVWIGSEGQRMAAPKRIDTSGMQLGRVAMGWNGYQALVVFAARVSDKVPWQVRGVTTFPGRRPEVPRVIVEKNASNPSVAGLSDGRWLLTWTVQQQDKFFVTGQTFDVSLAPLGKKPWRVSNKRSRTMYSGVGGTLQGGAVAYASPVGQMLEVQARALKCQ